MACVILHIGCEDEASSEAEGGTWRGCLAGGRANDDGDEEGGKEEEEEEEVEEGEVERSLHKMRFKTS